MLKELKELKKKMPDPVKDHMPFEEAIEHNIEEIKKEFREELQEELQKELQKERGVLESVYPQQREWQSSKRPIPCVSRELQYRDPEWHFLRGG